MIPIPVYRNWNTKDIVGKIEMTSEGKLLFKLAPGVELTDSDLATLHPSMILEGDGVVEITGFSLKGL